MSSFNTYPMEMPTPPPNRADFVRSLEAIETSYKKPAKLVLQALANPGENLSYLLHDGPDIGHLYMDRVIPKGNNMLLDAHLEIRNKKSNISQFDLKDFDKSLDHPESPEQISWRRMDSVEMNIKMPSERKVRFLGMLGIKAKARIDYRRNWFVDPAITMRPILGQKPEYKKVDNDLFESLSRDWDETTKTFSNHDEAEALFDSLKQDWDEQSQSFRSK